MSYLREQLSSPPEARELWQGQTEHDRSIGARDGDGVGDAYVGTAGVTMVSVAATHRRRGLMATMLRRQLDDIRVRGEPPAALVASEPGVFGRFGYGMATQ